MLTVLLTGILILQNNTSVRFLNGNILTYLGKRSYSIFIWHQVVLAFYRYFVSNKITILFVCGFIVAVLVLSEISYRLVEQRVKASVKSFVLWVGLAVLVIIPSYWIYSHAGVVRDVPEQNIKMSEVHKGMHAEYCDRVYKYDVDFPSPNGKPNVLVEGVSFGRDFANCLLESMYKDSVNLSYVFDWKEKNIDRIENADIIFSFTSRQNVPLYVWNNMKKTAVVWGIGTKNYGECNGIIYTRRKSKDYISSSVPMNPNYKELNDQWSSEWGIHYINFMKMATVEHGRIRVFTPDGKFISQDCEHLTQEGAQWYASIIDWRSMFKKDNDALNVENEPL